MQVTRIQIKNFMSLTDVDISPGQVNQIVGNNNNGKTTVIKALEFAIKGAADGSLVKFGEDAAEVIVELADSTTIRRRVSAEGKQSVSVGKDGMTARAPQALLDGLFDSSAFNPIDLLDPKRRHGAIMQSIELKVTPELLSREIGVNQDHLPALDYSQHGLNVLEQCHRYFYQRRAEANREADEKKRRWEAFKSDLPADEPARQLTSLDELKTQEVSIRQGIAAIDNEISMIEDKARALREVQAKHKSMVDNAAAYREHLAVKRRQLEDLERQIKEADYLAKQLEADVATAASQVKDRSALNASKANLNADLERINAGYTELRRVEEVKKQHARVDQLHSEWRVADEVATTLDKRVSVLANDVKQKLMASVEMPVEGLEFRDGAFYVDGASIDNLSTSKAMKLAIGIARKTAKKTKVICLDGAEALDEETYKALRAEIENDGFTYVVTKVGEPFNSPNDTVIKMASGQASRLQ